MAGLPDGWEADYDGSRWFYRYKPTGLAQFKFPRLGDEFPELVGLGFGPLDLAPEDELASEQQAKRRSGLDRIYNVGEVKKTSGNAMEVINKEDVPRSRGYFDPGGFMYFDPNEYTDISPVAIEENDITNLSSGEQTACELPEGPKQMWSQVGFIAELATSDTVKCAEELAPIELDATSSLQIPSRTNLPQNKAVELPTNRSPVEQEQSEQGTALPTMQPVEEDEYPLVSASFAYPPLKGTARPVNNAAPLQSSSSSQEPKVLTTERPTPSQPGQDKYQSWTPLQREQAETSKRQSMTLSNISILQLQNTELCPIQQKRHSLPGPIDSRKATPKLPDIMKPPTDPRLSVGALTPRPEAQHSPIPAVLQPAQASAQVSITQENHKQRPLGARHQSFPSDPGSTSKNDIDSNSSLSHTPSVLKPAQRRKSSQITQIQHIQNPHLPSPVRMPVYGDDAHPDYHRVDPLLKQTPSHTRPPPMMNGPGILVFHEIPSTQGLIIEQERVEGHRTSHVETQVSTATKTSSNDAITTSQNHEICDSTKQSYCPMDEPLPVVAPLSLSRPGRSGSPDKISAKINTLPQAPSSQSMPSELPAATITVASNSSPLPGSTERPTAHIYHSSHASPIQTPVPHHGLSGPAHAASNQMDIPAGEHHTSLQQITSSTGPTKPYSGAQAESHPVGHQVPTGQQTESHNDTHPSTLITSQQGPAEQVHGIHSGTHSQSQSATIIRPNSEAPVQAVSHRPEIGSPVSSHVQSVANTPIQPTSGQVLSSGSQKPPSIPLSQIASSSQSTMFPTAYATVHSSAEPSNCPTSIFPIQPPSNQPAEALPNASRTSEAATLSS
ncbi:hypothetical protein F5B20DRAFT_287342 [Whalleya microplaca]|nr:hypothetical protein F5B20DRAFT_287342 [Whalleya microplaca]